MNERVNEDLVPAIEKLTLHEGRNEAHFFCVPLCVGHNFQLFHVYHLI